MAMTKFRSDEETMMDEQWRPVVGYDEAYEISDFGKVRNARTGKMLHPALAGAGYEYVWMCINGKRVNRYIHRLVIASFVGPIEKGMEVNHKDGDKRNNVLQNLECVTHAENQRHASVHGLYQCGECHHAARLSKEDVIGIRKMRAETGVSYKKIGMAFGVYPQTAHAIVTGKRWGSVK